MNWVPFVGRRVRHEGVTKTIAVVGDVYVRFVGDDMGIVQDIQPIDYSLTELAGMDAGTVFRQVGGGWFAL